MWFALILVRFGAISYNKFLSAYHRRKEIPDLVWNIYLLATIQICIIRYQWENLHNSQLVTAGFALFVVGDDKICIIHCWWRQDLHYSFMVKTRFSLFVIGNDNNCIIRYWWWQDLHYSLLVRIRFALFISDDKICIIRCWWRLNLHYS